MVQTVAAMVSGTDRPGLMAQLLGAIRDSGAEVLDLEQLVVRGQLTFGLLLSGPRDMAELEDRLAGACARLGLTLQIAEGVGDNPPRPNRVIVTMLGRPLLAEHVAAVATIIAEHGGNIDRSRRLSRRPLTSLEFWVSRVGASALRSSLAACAAASGFDIAVSPAGLVRRGRRLVVMDVDSTLIRDEVIELLADRAGRGAEVAAVTEAAMRGELDFAESLHARVAALEGLPESVFDDVRAEIRLTPGARTLVETLKDLGMSIGVVSGGFIEVVGPLASDLGITHARANRLEVQDGRLTGRVSVPWSIGPRRPSRCASSRRWRGFRCLARSPSGTVRTIWTCSRGGTGVAFNAKPKVRASADTAPQPALPGRRAVPARPHRRGGRGRRRPPRDTLEHDCRVGYFPRSQVRK